MKKSALLLIAACLSVGVVQAKPAPAAAPKASERCPPEPGSRISRPPAADGRCDKASSSLVRSYSHEDLERSGQVDVGEALRTLDPSLTRPTTQGGSGH